MLMIGWAAVAVLLQDQGGEIPGRNARLLVIFIALVAVAMVVQAIVVVTASIAALKAQRRVQQIAEEMRTKLLPIMSSTEDLLKESVPKFRTITDNFAETSRIVRSKAEEMDATLTEVNEKTRTQVARLDGMVTSALTRTGEIGEMIHQGVRAPVKQIAGLMNGVRAGLDVLMSRARDFGADQLNRYD